MGWGFNKKPTHSSTPARLADGLGLKSNPTPCGDSPQLSVPPPFSSSANLSGTIKILCYFTYIKITHIPYQL